MIGTHSVKAIDATIKQSGISAEIKEAHNPNLISSQTVRMRRKFFAIPANAATMKQYLEECRAMPGSDMVSTPILPNITSGKVKQILLPYAGSYVSASPVGSCGLLYELFNRIKEKELPHFKWTIQPNPASLGNYGESVMLQRGVMRHFARLRKNYSESKWSGDYVQLNVRLERCVINAGMMATGFPAITAFGGMAHALERATGDQVDFAISVNKTSWHSGVPKIINTRVVKEPKPAYYSAEMLGSFYLTIIFRSSGSLASLASESKKLTRIAGGVVFNSTVSVHYNDTPPTGAYINDSSPDIETDDYYNPYSDTLGMAMSRYQHEPYTSIIQSGFSFLEEPKERPLTRNGFPHAWCEPVFCLINTGALTEKSFWRRYEQKGGVFWHGYLS
ncbi:hypothetical protein ACFL9S_18135 [Erwinia sp. AnSW2-5]|uniref:hypothetical protein n=1 Tax=Erwinia sp. AnSW2-5 TaxID=3367692 RepID=UPI00385AD9C1